MNLNEEAFIKYGETYSSHPQIPLGLETVPLCRVLLIAIMSDVQKILPNGSVAEPACIAAFSEEFSNTDGLLPAYYNSSFEEKVQRPAYLIALTTIWIANYTRPIESKRRNKKERLQRKYQVCLLYYCFNLLTGTLPLKEERCFKEKILQRFSRTEWMGSEATHVQLERFKFAFEMLHDIGLEYYDPKMELDSISEVTF